MAWETRGNNQFYYKKEREGDKVRSIYYGNSEIAELIAQLDQNEKWQKQIAKNKADEEKREFEKVDEMIEEFAELNRMLVDAAYLLNGFHQHKREWRRKRK